jgi:CspA family cold shock protein
VREKGLVKWFNAAKGYGFIQRSSGEDVFVHFSAIEMSGYRTLEEGSEVEFEVKRGPKGLQAENVNRPYEFFNIFREGRPNRGGPVYFGAPSPSLRSGFGSAIRSPWISNSDCHFAVRVRNFSRPECEAGIEALIEVL